MNDAGTVARDEDGIIDTKVRAIHSVLKLKP
jgi:hypothetical protein